MQHNPILFYFYKAFNTYYILENWASNILDKHSSNSIGFGIILYANYAQKKDSTKIRNEEDNDKGPPLVKVARLLASAFTIVIHTNNNQSVNDADKEEKCQDSLQKAMLHAEETKKLLQNDNG